MKLRNILQIVTLTGLIASGSTQCMFVNGLKWVLQKSGTAIGMGITVVPSLIYPMRKCVYNQEPTEDTITKKNVDGMLKLIEMEKNNDIKVIKKTEVADFHCRKPFPEEEAFLRKYISKDTNIIINPLPGSSTHHKNTIVMEGKMLGSNCTLQEAINGSKAKELAMFAAVAERTNIDLQNNMHDFYQNLLHRTTLPIVRTGTCGALFKYLFPYNKGSSLLRHIGRFGVKTSGGILLFLTNFAFVHRNDKHMILENDQKISAANRDGLKSYLTARNERSKQFMADMVKQLSKNSAMNNDQKQTLLMFYNKSSNYLIPDIERIEAFDKHRRKLGVTIKRPKDNTKNT